MSFILGCVVGGFVTLFFVAAFNLDHKHNADNITDAELEKMTK